MVHSYILLLSLLICSFSITVTPNGCACNEVILESECDVYYGRACEWNTETAVCEDPLPQDCPFMTTLGQYSCHAEAECAWVNGACVDFTKCSDLVPTVDYSCNYMKASCTTSDAGKCIDTPVPSCSSRTVQTSCSISCVWTGTECVDFDSCAKGSYSYEQCNNNLAACYYETASSTCRAKTCADILTQSNCKYVLSFDWKSATLCHWSDDGKCVDGEESHYTEANCFEESAYGKVWVDGKCVSCNSGNIISVVLMILAIMIMI